MAKGSAEYHGGKVAGAGELGGPAAGGQKSARGTGGGKTNTKGWNTENPTREAPGKPSGVRTAKTGDNC